MKVFLGIDTSCYTTSVAFLKEDGTLAADARRLLKVKPGSRGLAQSEMVYQHTRNLPEVFAEALNGLDDGYQLAAVGVSVTPRPLADSFMPAFLVGAGYAKVLALSHGVELCPLSHQENHILAGIWSAGGPSAGRFLAVHISGGTTEVAIATRQGNGFIVTLLGGSRDISAGQFIDRVGVALGLPFPAGPELERLALCGHTAPAKIPQAVEQMKVSFSGPETHALRLIDKGQDPATLAAGVEVCIASSLTTLIQTAIDQTGIIEVLIVGGVAANGFIRNYLVAGLERDATVRLYFPKPNFSSDNAIGAAYFALRP